LNFEDDKATETRDVDHELFEVSEKNNRKTGNNLEVSPINRIFANGFIQQGVLIRM
jgi:hypothetical protein